MVTNVKEWGSDTEEAINLLSKHSPHLLAKMQSINKIINEVIKP